MKRFTKKETEFLKDYVYHILNGSLMSSSSVKQSSKKVFADLVNLSKEELLERATRFYKSNEGVSF
jgi:hypothetical protein